MKFVMTAKEKDLKFGIQTVVMFDNKIEAKINHPNKYHPNEFTIEVATLMFYRPSLEDAIEFVRSGFENRLNAFGTNVTVVMEK